MSALLGATALLLLALLPPAVLGGFFAGVPGALAGAAAGYVLLLYTAISSERILTSRVGARSDAACDGLEFTLRQVLLSAFPHEEPPFRPLLLVYPDPLPNAFVVRSFTGSGRLLLSSGLLEQLDEAELRAVLTACILKNHRRDWPFRSLCSALALQVLRLAPASWGQLLFSGDHSTQRLRDGLSPFSLARFALLLPALGLLRALAGKSPPAFSALEAGDSAMHKITRANASGGWRPLPGAELLSMSDPGPRSRILR
ncbi:MAG: M48 family metalloprotease [Oligoflexia bacterium]|nr:M48 family metalloprotease [Oligoflexia bacterium]